MSFLKEDAIEEIGHHFKNMADWRKRTAEKTIDNLLREMQQYADIIKNYNTPIHNWGTKER